jgi:DNA-binding NarL/FixJ family response regulator
LVRAIGFVVAGPVDTYPKPADKLAKKYVNYYSIAELNHFGELTLREAETARLIARGHSNNQIANRWV